jgi:phage terminase large subunit
VPVETLERLINPATIADFKEDPLLFVKSIFRVSPTSQQEEVLRKFRDSPAVAIKSGHGVGKTAMEAWLILWFLFLNPMARIPCTAPTQAQLHDILWPEINLWLNRSILQRYISWSKSRVSIIGQDETWFAVARTSNKPANLQGFHGQALMYVVEEASGVPQEIMEVIEGAMTNVGARLLMAGNPTQISGTFYDAFHKDASLYTRFTFSAVDSPIVSDEYAKRIEKKYGKDSDVYRVRVEGQFPQGAPDAFIRLDAVERAILREVTAEGRYWFIGVDPARFGDDESVIYYRQGYKVFRPRGFHGIDTSELSGQVMKVVREIREKDAEAKIYVRVDDTGVGGGVSDQLRPQTREHGFDLQEVNFGGKGNADYYNLGAKIWGDVRDALDELDLPDIDDLIAQLTTRKYRITPDGKIRLEAKEDMKKRGLPSPDHGDALALCVGDPQLQIPRIRSI